MSGIDLDIADKALKFVALFGSGMITGNAFYVSAVAHPAMLAMGSIEAGARSWYECFVRTKDIQIKLSVLTSIGTFGTFILNKYHGSSVSPTWLFLGIAINALVPYTLVFIAPINNILLEKDTVVKEKGETTVKQLIKSWGKVHMVRTLVNVVAFGAVCYSCIF